MPLMGSRWEADSALAPETPQHFLVMGSGWGDLEEWDLIREQESPPYIKKLCDLLVPSSGTWAT